MAPQENDPQDLHASLIPSSEEDDDILEPRLDSPSDQSSLLSDHPLDVIIVQPEDNRGTLSNGDAGAADGKQVKMKGNKKKGPEVPVNCPHLETALFFFGIAGMAVSVIMLLQHIISSLISYY